MREYLRGELEIEEITPETIISKLNKDFLEARSDQWVRSMYEFLSGQRALHHQALALPIVRLEDGGHVRAKEKGQPLAFLPADVETSFPTVRVSVCNTKESGEYLRSLGLTEPLPVDDVILNVLPKYSSHEVYVAAAEYESDINRIRRAFRTDSQVQRNKLLTALRETSFVRVVENGDARKEDFSTPSLVYLPTDRLKDLFNRGAGCDSCR